MLDILPSWAQTAFLTLVLCVYFKSVCFLPLSLPFLLLFSVSLSLSFITYPFLLFFFFLPLTLFPAISYQFLSCPSCTTQTLLLPSLFTSVWYRHYNPLSISVLLNCSLLSSPSSFSFSPSFSAHQYVPFVSPLCMCYFYHGVALDYDFYPLLLLCSFSSTYYHILY